MTRTAHARVVALLTALVMVGTACATSSPGATTRTDDAPVEPTEASDSATSPSPSPRAVAAGPVLDDDADLKAAMAAARPTLPPEVPIVRGVYSTMYSFWGGRWEYMLDLVRDTEINAIVIDVKDDGGQLAWQSQVPLAVEGGGGEWKPDADPRPRLQELTDVGGYPIARVVCFKDSEVALARPDLAVIDVRTGEPWQGRDGEYWLNPYRDEAWQYCIDIGKEAARMGFAEIQFDYVRFPNGGDGPSLHFSFPGVPEDRPREEWRHPDVITRFLSEARRQLHREGARVSADIFGLTTYNWTWDGDGTGQVFERLAAELDYVSPMVYPSHYSPGNYGLLPHPVDHPYATVFGAMEEARTRAQGLRAKIRPWIEDFAPSWLGRGHSPQRVLDQKRAVYENGIEGWLLWNASNRFSEAALEGTTESRADPDHVPLFRERDPDPAPGADPVRWPGYDPSPPEPEPAATPSPDPTDPTTDDA